MFVLKEQLDEIIKTCFDNDPVIAGERDKKYGSVFTDDYNLAVKMAEFSDFVFQKEIRGLNE